RRNKVLAEQGNRNARGKSGENNGPQKSGKTPADSGKGGEGGKANRLFGSEPVEPETGENASKTNQDHEEYSDRFKGAQKNASKDHGAKDNAQAKGRESNEEDSAWKDFWGKIKKDGSVLESVQAKGLHSGTEVSQDKAPDVMSRMENVSPREVLRQVEAGMIKNLGQGKQQITLRLNPPELGRVNVVVQVSGKEITALIRPENHDASKMIGDNLAHLRQSLEQQGLKVSKLEVQTQLPDGQLAQNWHGADKHNLARQQNDAALPRGNRRSLQDGANDLAQEMQNPAERVKISQEGLDIFA
ncbi:MAG: flagellar hook-length control protein FliK, partial [Thermodesulfobacteriota bacterium]|nr:flagellar hook-length control protein FliK [Thermodesulfobacteriota bacterium]